MNKTQHLTIVTTIGIALILMGVIWYFIPSEEENSENTQNRTQAVIGLQDKGCPDFNQDILLVDDHEFEIGIARTTEERRVGLGGCASMADNQGLLFVFEESREAAFWMKDMLIAIDIIWISNGEVVGIEHNLPPPASMADEDLPIYISPGPVDSVLEIAAGGSIRHGIEVGSEISF